jgi:hypothetical protein
MITLLPWRVKGVLHSQPHNRRGLLVLETLLLTSFDGSRMQ